MQVRTLAILRRKTCVSRQSGTERCDDQLISLEERKVMTVSLILNCKRVTLWTSIQGFALRGNSRIGGPASTEFRCGIAPHGVCTVRLEGERIRSEPHMGIS